MIFFLHVLDSQFFQISGCIPIENEAGVAFLIPRPLPLIAGAKHLPEEQGVRVDVRDNRLIDAIHDCLEKNKIFLNI